MEISFFGHACVKLRGKKGSVVCDPFDPTEVGIKLANLSADIVTVSCDHPGHNNVNLVHGNPFPIIGPGEYEIKGMNIIGVETFADKKQGKELGKNTVYQITVDDITVVHLGRLGHIPNEDQLEEFNGVDILFVPAGDEMLTVKEATEVVAKFEPLIIIPMLYKTTTHSYKTLKEVDAFVKEMGRAVSPPIDKLVITKDKLPGEAEVVLVETK